MLSSGHWSLLRQLHWTWLSVLVSLSALVTFLLCLVDDRFHVVHAAVANFDVILFEKAVVLVLFREVLRNKVEKCCADVSLDVFTERRVVPDDISLSVAPRSCRLRFAERSISESRTSQ